MTEEKRNENGLTYKQWMKQLDAYLAGKAGISSLDLADTDTYSAWSHGGSPQDHGSDMLYDEGFPQDEDNEY